MSPGLKYKLWRSAQRHGADHDYAAITYNWYCASVFRIACVYLTTTDGWLGAWAIDRTCDVYKLCIVSNVPAFDHVQNTLAARTRWHILRYE